MVFSSIVFLFYFLPVFLALYYGLRPRNAIFLLASILFYAWGEVGFTALIGFSILCNYALGLLIERAEGRARRAALAAGVAANLALLGLFKYANFLAEAIGPLLSALDLPRPAIDSIHLPLGISFFTFQAITYVVDVYRRDAPAERSFLRLALYISMFPQLVAGPIVRFHTIARELRARTHSVATFAAGVQAFVIGLAQKLLIANSLGTPADAIFAIAPEHLSAPVAWLGVVSYSLQIYFDFAGYSNMAIGLGLMCGFHLPQNFDSPYISQSVSEFWRRWHITLSRWFRDYLYIPLGGNRRGPVRTYLNLVLVFFLCGLWHGASFNFIVWGLYHGAFLVMERLGLSALLARTWRLLRHLYLLLVVMIGWVIFRAESLEHALRYLEAMGGGGAAGDRLYPLRQYATPEVALVIACGVAASVPMLPVAQRGLQAAASALRPGAQALALRLVAIGLLGALMLMSGMVLASGAHNPFIYFRF